VAQALRHLPDVLLRAMVSGLGAHADELAPGVLFRGTSSGGCAVGITLRELAPDAFEFGLFRFWLWQRWRRGVERDVARRHPRLKHLQWYFDEAVAELEQAGREPQPAKAVGLWLAASAEAELTARGAGSDRKPTGGPDHHARRRVRTPNFGPGRDAAANRMRPGSEAV
jgi:hypothetical protein